MASIATAAVKLPRIYASFQEFLKNNVFGEREEEELHKDDVEQRVYMRRYNAEVEEAKAREKGKKANISDECE